MRLLKMVSSIAALLSLATGQLVAAPPERVTLKFQTGTVIRFSEPEEAGRWLAEEDLFLKSLSPFDRSARMKTSKAVAPEAFQAFVKSQTLAWENAEMARLSNAVSRVSREIEPLHMAFPAEIVLIKTTGAEEGQAAYCRRNAIVFPLHDLKKSANALHDLLLHELFHVFSSHHPEKRQELYRVVGFDLTSPVELPKSLAARRITNPDAPAFNAVIHLKIQGARKSVAPILIASSSVYQEVRGGEFFDYLQFRLMEVHPAASGFAPALSPSGEPQLFDPDQTPDYLEKVGRNTSYIIHPEEILADNFMHLVKGTPNLPSPEAINRLRSALTPKIAR